MESKEIGEYRKREEEVQEVEAEIVSGWPGKSRSRENGGATGAKRSLLRFKLTLFFIVLSAGLLMIFLSFVLTASLIGAIIGIPLMILGISLFSFAFKILFSKSASNFEIFRF